MSVQTAILGSQTRADATFPVKMVGALFFFSGASSLIFETLFTRLLSYTFGNTAYAASTVLAAFLGGLALGAYLIGRFADRVRPTLLMYGALELAIGLYGLAVPSLFAALTRVYVSLFHSLAPGPVMSTVVRFILAGVVIAVPAALMGGTLPVLARTVAALRPDYHSEVAKFYAINTFGAALGTLVSTYVLMPNWGVRGAITAAFFMNATIFLCTTWLDRAVLLGSWKPLPSHPEERPGYAAFDANQSELDAAGFSLWDGKKADVPILFSAFFAGLVTISYEVIWTHALAFLVGNAVYAFGMMLFTFLCGLAMGAHLVSRLSANLRSWAWAFALSQALAGIAVMLTLPLWNLVPALFEEGVQTARVLSLLAICVPVGARLIWVATTGMRSRWKEAALELLILIVLGLGGTLPLRGGLSYFVATEALRFFIAFYLLIIPIFFLGISFPSLLNLFNRSRRQTGRSVGSIYAVNTVGSIAGAILAGFALLPLLGSYATLQLSATLNVALGFGFAFLILKPKRSWKMAFAAALACAVLVAVFQPLAWDMKRLTRGTYVYFQRGWRPDKVLYASEDVHGGLTTVIQSGDNRTLLTNGKFQGNNTGEITEQVRVALIPTLFTKAFDHALVIGLGTGGSLHTVAAFPFRRIDTVELAPSVVEAARTWFADVNRNVLDRDPRVHLSMADGRNYLLVSQDRYDLITMEVSSIWISGEADLYNKEFYQLCRSHLRERGVLQQWVQVHHMRPTDFFVILNTAAQVFPHVAFFLGPEQGLLIASSSPLDIDYDQIHAMEKIPSIRHELDVVGAHSMFSLLGEIVLYDQSYRAAISRFYQSGGLASDFVSTDAYPYLEYQTPKGNVLPRELVMDSYFFSRLRAPTLPPDLMIRGVPGPGYSEYISALALEDRQEYLAAASRFDKIEGSLRDCAQSEIEWIRAVRSRMPGSPMPVYNNCRYGDWIQPQLASGSR
jgi:spermidine synthase